MLGDEFGGKGEIEVAEEELTHVFRAGRTRAKW
jgi:hypothetical protein